MSHAITALVEHESWLSFRDDEAPLSVDKWQRQARPLRLVAWMKIRHMNIFGPWQSMLSSESVKKPLLIDDLGWSIEEAAETRARFRTFQDDWEAPGMEVYDDL